MNGMRFGNGCVYGVLALCVGLAAAAGGVTPFPHVSAPRALTSGPHEHLLASYFAIDSWSPNLRYVLALETDLNGRLPEAGERCMLGVVDLNDGNRFIPVTTTACWNFQEAAMAFWLDDETILFNDTREGKFRAVVMDWRAKRDVRVLPMPVSAVSEDRIWAVSVNYARLSLTRPDYGYAGPGQDPLENVEWPENDGLWTMDLKTGETKLVLSIAQGRPLMPPTRPEPGKSGHPLAYYCHTVISKDGAKIFFLARSVNWFDKTLHKASIWDTTSFTVNRDGSDLRRCFKDGWAGSHFNWAPDGSHKMIVTAKWNGHLTGLHWSKTQIWSPVEFTVGDEEHVRHVANGAADRDWHCVYSPDGAFMSGETYWDPANRVYDRPWVLIRLEDDAILPIGSFYVPEAYRSTYWRCDLHARWRRDGRQLAFNSVHEGSRQIYVMDVTPALLTLRSAQGRATVSLKGARLCSWKDAPGREMLFMPDRTDTLGGDWSHGGIPLCWPWFGRQDGVIHGFIRNKVFALRRQTENSLTLGYTLKAGEEKSFPHAADCEVTFSLDKALTVTVKTTNVGKEPFTYTGGMHPYFQVGDYGKIAFEGVDVAPFALADGMDKGFARRAEGAFSFTDASLNRRIRATATGNSHVIVWTPGTVERANRNLAPEDTVRFIGYGPGLTKAAGGVTLKPGQSHVLTLTLEASELR